MSDNRCAKHKYYGSPPSYCFVCEALALRAEVKALREIIETHALPPGCECVPCKRIREEMKALRGGGGE